MHGLLDPADPNQPSFDLVVPSLPGFCWSQGPPRGWSLQDTARMYDGLMKRLGYTAYAAQAGDWGHWVVRELGSGRYDACKAVHTNMCPGAPPEGYELNEKEKKAMARAQWWMGSQLNEGHMGYAIEMRTRPHTIGVAFNDNPVGIMMFIGEKYNELADPNLGTATLDNEGFNHDVCTTLSLYFFTPPSIMTSKYFCFLLLGMVCVCGCADANRYAVLLQQRAARRVHRVQREGGESDSRAVGREHVSV
jgi:hypothetical protein